LNTHKPYVMLAALSLAAMACTCGPLSAAQQAADEAVEEAGETLEAVEVEAEEQGGAAVESAAEEEQPAEDQQAQGGEPVDFTLGETGLENLSSYEYIQTVDFSGTNAEGQPAEMHMEVHIIHQVEPLINSIRTQMTSEGMDDDTQSTGEFSTLFVYIDGMTYTEMEMPGMDRTCFAVEGGEEDLETYDTSFYDLDPEEFSDFDTEPEFVVVSTNEDVNGIPSTHYRAENINVDEGEGGTIDVWIANDGGYMTRMIMEGVGKDSELGDGQFSMTWELLSANQPVNVTPPEDCQSY
jgi:hypothetical protein